MGYPSSVRRYRVSGIWSTILKFGKEFNVVGTLFKDRVGFKVGKGDQVRFWFDDWVRLFRVASSKKVSIQECFSWRGCVVSINLVT